MNYPYWRLLPRDRGSLLNKETLAGFAAFGLLAQARPSECRRPAGQTWPEPIMPRQEQGDNCLPAAKAEPRPKRAILNCAIANAPKNLRSDPRLRRICSWP